jgi:hypothetical protein
MSGDTEPTTDPAAAQADAAAAHDADRAPTPEEERVAEQQAAEVDPASGEHYREMAERGANLEGEGEIVPE